MPAEPTTLPAQPNVAITTFFSSEAYIVSDGVFDNLVITTTDEAPQQNDSSFEYVINESVVANTFKTDVVNNVDTLITHFNDAYQRNKDGIKISLNNISAANCDNFMLDTMPEQLGDDEGDDDTFRPFITRLISNLNEEFVCKNITFESEQNVYIKISLQINNPNSTNTIVYLIIKFTLISLI